MNRGSNEEEAVLRVLARYGIQIDEHDVAAEIARAIVVACERERRRADRVTQRQCGAPTLNGWACRNERLPGNSGCKVHPHWRELRGNKG